MKLSKDSTLLHDNGKTYIDCIYKTTVKMSQKYLELINCSEFARLKNISQNGFSNIDFPGLYNNNRYEHSIGVFLLLSKMIKHLETQLKQHGISIPQEDKDIALTSMLLHDIGHGPFSHLSERFTKYSHEDRAADILLDDTQIHEVLTRNYPASTIQKIVKFMADESMPQISSDSNFLTVLKKLMSSQLDADRIDYTMRDTFHMGGKTAIDWQKLITALGITIRNDGKYEIVIKKKDMSLAETLLFERYKNYKDVYYNGSALIGENSVFKTLTTTVANQVRNGDPISIYLSKPFLKYLMKPQKLSTQEFLQLDDNIIFEGFEVLNKHSRDPLVRYLTHEKGATAIQDFEQIYKDNPKEIYTSIMQSYFGSPTAESFGCFAPTVKVAIYKDKDAEGIKIDRGGGDIVDITKASAIINLDVNARGSEDRLYINPKILEMELATHTRTKLKTFNKEALLGAIKESTTDKEFEVKHKINGDVSANDIVALFARSGFSISNGENIVNNDIYFDTEQKDLLKQGGSLRVRRATKGDNQKIKGTYKMPVASKGKQVFAERTEIERNLTDTTFKALEQFITIENIDISPSASPVLRADTDRQSFKIEKDSKQYQLAIDATEYTRQGISKGLQDKMIEVEAMGDTANRVGLIEINRILTESGLPLIPITMSKYETGSRLLYPEHFNQTDKTM